ncbi:MAG: hypothetical protein RLZZ515_1490 [Cyanobacteriota bacterium]|jgi:hypothetical protein
METLNGISRVLFTGQPVTVERDSNSTTGWTATGWAQGLPVARKPISAEELGALLARFPDHVLRR